MPYYAKVILDSIGPCGNRLTTMEFTIPKLWLAEFNTHCMFARNSASTRAIPYKKQRQRVLDDSFVPYEWPLEQKGMSASENEANPHEISMLEKLWLTARDKCVDFADQMADPAYHSRPIHKQLAGRILELWQYQTVLVTGDAASYANFFYLRRNKAAAPEIRKAAELMWESYSQSQPQKLKAGEWHTPLIREDELEPFDLGPSLYGDDLLHISAARCARVSYLTHAGIRDVSEDRNLFQRLTANGHWSPLEHVCQALDAIHPLCARILRALGGEPKRQSKWCGWRSLRSIFPNEYIREYAG